ncbi:MAG: hypothetical protein GX793_05995 [Bacteroidales bacterium]|jgi:hypothetical protein|nr:hypothetical protein [Bacteroidales bacterium]
MVKSYPTIGEYNQIIQQQGGNAFNSLRGVSFVPSRAVPIKVYLFGSGAYAAVFKGAINDTNYAIRCFLTAENETIRRYEIICDYLKNIQSSWKTGCELLENEIQVNGNAYPVLKMEWLDGVLINQFVSNNIAENNVLNELQKKLVAISDDLEKNKIGHGDLQCGNIIVTGTSTNFQVKLIDYDGMYVPNLTLKKAVEKGRSEFQHPERTMNNFNSEIDRFAFWVIITALEALKIDKTLWQEVMQGGFNTLDNFLFTAQDFLNPYQSALFNRLYNLNSRVLNFYLDKLKSFCVNGYASIAKPVLSGQSSGLNSEMPTAHKKCFPPLSNSQAIDQTVSNSIYKIITNGGSASVLTSTFQKLGSTPLEIDKNLYEGKVLLISNGKETKRITLNSHQNLIEINFK